MDNGSIQKFPLDFDTLKKGDEISTSQIESFGNCSKDDDPAFEFAGLRLAKWIEAECRERGTPIRARFRKNVIVLLTDEEAADYDNHRARRMYAKMIQSVRHLSEVNTLNLSDDKRHSHERNIFVLGAMVLAGNSARARAVAMPYQRTIPGLPPATPKAVQSS